MKVTWNTIRKATLVAMLGSFAIAMVACHGRSRGGYYLPAWYDVYGYQCGTGQPRPGCNFYADGTKIRDYQDPYYSSSNVLYYDLWSYTDSYGYQQYYLGYAWLSSTGILYDEYGYALNEDQESEGRDIISEVADQAEASIEDAGLQLAAKLKDKGHVLSEESAVDIARALDEWMTLSGKRSPKGQKYSRRPNMTQQQARDRAYVRTEQDELDVGRRLYGIDLTRARQALAEAQQGRTEALVSVNNDIANHWGTRPETSSYILKNWYKAQLAEYNVE